jgi:hypothetical protein
MASLLSLPLRFSTAARTGLLVVQPVASSVSGCRFHGKYLRSFWPSAFVGCVEALTNVGYWRFMGDFLNEQDFRYSKTLEMYN